MHDKTSRISGWLFFNHLWPELQLSYRIRPRNARKGRQIFGTRTVHIPHTNTEHCPDRSTMKHTITQHELLAQSRKRRRLSTISDLSCGIQRALSQLTQRYCMRYSDTAYRDTCTCRNKWILGAARSRDNVTTAATGRRTSGPENELIPITLPTTKIMSINNVNTLYEETGFASKGISSTGAMHRVIHNPMTRDTKSVHINGGKDYTRPTQEREALSEFTCTCRGCLSFVCSRQERRLSENGGERALYVLEFARTHSTVAVRRSFQTRVRKTTRRWGTASCSDRKKSKVTGTCTS